MKYDPLLVLGLTFIALLSLYGCDDVDSSEPNVDNSHTVADKQIEKANPSPSDPEGEAFDTLYGDTQPVLPLFRLTALDEMWSFEDVVRTSTTYQNHAPKAESCADPATPVFNLPEETSLEISFFTLQSEAGLQRGFRRSCFPEWDVDFEYVPGILQSRRIETGPPRQICGLCEDAQGQPVPGTALIFNIVEATE